MSLDYLQKLIDHLETLSDAKLLALYEDDDGEEGRPTTPLLKALYKKHPTQLLRCEIDGEIRRRWIISAKKSAKSAKSAKK